MTFDEFTRSLAGATPDPALSRLLAALWWDRKGDWNRAHELADTEGPDAAWVHAYIHRKEGDEANAGYWYTQAGRPRLSVSGPPALEEEWKQIAEALLDR